MRLNRYIALSGYCSRRKADELILSQKVSINNHRVATLGSKVEGQDQIVVEGKRLYLPQKFIYLIMNKPLDVITTKKDPLDRKTVLDIIRQSKQKNLAQVSPVGRLDRDTTGVLLFTNDGNLLHFLTHPSNQITKVYEVLLKENINLKTLTHLREGIKLEDGLIKPNLIKYASHYSKKKIIIKMHSGKNRIIRRMMREVNHHILKLNRLSFAKLSASGLGYGRFRELSSKEVKILKVLQDKK